jgi:Cohesin domain
MKAVVQVASYVGMSLLLIAPIARPDSQATLSLPNDSVAAGGSNTANVSYKGHGELISAFQFDLHFDSAHINVIPSIGPAAAAAGKQLQYNVLPDGTLRTIVFGINQTVIPDGNVVTLTVQASSQSGKFEVQPSGVVASNPDGQALPLNANNATVTVH